MTKKQLMEMVWKRKGCQDPISLVRWYFQVGNIFGSYNRDDY